MTSARLKTIDGLRGVAAGAVVIYHLSAAMVEYFDSWVWPWLADALAQGFLGVDVFFVLSGFVIAYSVRNARPTLQFLGRFAVRRSFRLDPPYWAAIACETALIWITIRLGLGEPMLPSVEQVVAHLFYAQNLLELGDISPIFWTLCFEIQFYLAFIAVLVAGRALRERIGPGPTKALGAGLFAAAFLYSVAVRYGVFGLSAHPGLAIIRWFQFFMGTAVWWVVSGVLRTRVLMGLWGVLAVAVLAQGEPLLQLLPIGVSGLLLWSYRKDRMATALSGPILQFLGKISYSLYLFHAAIGWRVVSLSALVLGTGVSLARALGVYVVAIASAVAFAWLMWWVLERPSIRWSRRIRLRRGDASPVSAFSDASSVA